MGIITETELYPATIYQIEDGDNGSGGPDGTANAASIALANRTKFLKARVEELSATLALALTQGPETPLAALPMPTIATADNKLVITAAGGGAGGQILVGAGQWLTLAVPVVAGITARAASWTTESWSESDLLVSTTYFFRGQIVANALLIYLARGTDNDAIPASRRGTPGAASGCGFDSTEQDILFAKIVTGVAGSIPTVTALENRHELEIVLADDANLPGMRHTFNDLAPIAGTAQTLNWARAPRLVEIIPTGFASQVTPYVSFSEGLALISLRPAGACTRYSTSDVSYLFDDDSSHSSGHAYWNWRLKA